VPWVGAVSARLRALVRAVPGARALRRAILDFGTRRNAARDTAPPRGAFDRPDGLTVTRESVAFGGWALVGTRTVASVDLVFNDVTTQRAVLGGPRPDVRRALGEPRAASSCGWSATVDLASWPLGALRVRAIATSRSGMSTVIGERSYALVGEGFEGYLDEPREGAELHGDLLVVQGWATIEERPAARIDVEFDGRPVGRARLRLARSDVEHHGSGRLGPVTGFEYRGVVPKEAGSVEVGLTVHGFDGQRVVVPPRRVRIVQDGAGFDATTVAAMQARTLDVLAALPVPERRGDDRAGPRLLVFTHALTLGGGQLYLSELLRLLMPWLGHCTVVSPLDGILRSELEALGIEVIIDEDPQPRDIERYEEHVRSRARFIRTVGCDVVLLNTLGPWSSGDGCMRAGVPYLWAIHESFELSDWLGLNFGIGGLPAYTRSRIEGALRGAHRLVFEAHATSALFAAFADAPHRVVVPYGVDTEAIGDFIRGFDRAAARRERAIDPDATVLLAVGVFEERKSQACIVDAFTEVAATCPEAHLVLVGDQPCAYADAVHRMVAASPVAGRISLIPITSGIWAWYALSDLLVSAADIESMPRSMLEAMAFGVPVLSTDVFGVPEAVADGVSGWLFEARDIGALIAAMRRVLALSVEERRAVGTAAQAEVREHHRSSGYAAAYRTLIAGAMAPDPDDAQPRSEA
jgi:D-inositol-3-phosphate glycosyltransferase